MVLLLNVLVPICNNNFTSLFTTFANLKIKKNRIKKSQNLHNRRIIKIKLSEFTLLVMSSTRRNLYKKTTNLVGTTNPKKTLNKIFMQKFLYQIFYLLGLIASIPLARRYSTS